MSTLVWLVVESARTLARKRGRIDSTLWDERTTQTFSCRFLAMPKNIKQPEEHKKGPFRRKQATRPECFLVPPRPVDVCGIGSVLDVPKNISPFSKRTNPL